MSPVLALGKSACACCWKIPLAACELERVFAAMLDAAGVSCPAVEAALVDLMLLDDAAMEALHAKAMGCAGPTNILAFPVIPGQARILGSLALSVDALERECFLYGQELLEHCIRLLAHGLTHLLGHAHGPAMDALSRRMEKAALAACGPA